MKKVCVLLVVVWSVMIFSVAIGFAAEQKVVGVTSLWLGNDWNTFCSSGIKNYLEERGYKVIHTNAMGQTRQQIADTESLVERKVDGIIIAGGEGNAFFDVSNKAKEAGIPLIGVDMVLPGAISGVYADNYSGGTQMGLFMTNKIKGSGKVIVLDTPGWQSLLIRKRMALATFAEYPDIEVLNEFEVGTSDPITLAYNIVKGVLRQHPDLKGVITTWDFPTVGAIKAIKEMEKTDQVVISSADPGRPLLAEMAKEDAPIIMNMGQNARVLGQLAAKYIDIALTEGVDKVPLTVFGPTYFISNDPENDFSNLKPLTIIGAWDELYFDVKRPF